MLFAWSRRRSSLCQAVALLGVWALPVGVAWGQQSQNRMGKVSDISPTPPVAKPPEQPKP